MITTEVTFNDWWDWLNKDKDSSYHQYFSYEGAKALYEYISEASDNGESEAQLDNFDPIAWCVEFSEYGSVSEAYKEHYGDDSDLPMEQRRTTEEQQLEYFEDNTIVINNEPNSFLIADF